LVEEEIDDLEYGVEPPGQLAHGRLEGESELTDLLLRANETLRNGRRLGQERARDLADTETRNRLQRQGDAALSRQARVTSDEHEPYDVIDVAKRVVVRFVVLVTAFLIETNGIGQLLRLAVEDVVALEDVERAILRHSCEPCGWILGNAMVRPDFECLDQGVLSNILGKIEVLGTESTREERDKPASLVAKEVVDQPLDIMLG